MYNYSTLRIVLFCVVLICCHVTTHQKGSLVTLDEDSWSELLTGEWMVEFYAPWCPACKALEPEWKNFAGWSDDLGIKIGAVDVTANPGLSGRFMVTALPTIYHVKEGVFRQYKGARDSNTFVSFIEEKKWEAIEPVSNWKSPNSIQMTIVSYFFKISMALRAVHNRLVEDYGIPYWGSYILFAFATILLGALLGLLIVCIIDLLFPTKVEDFQTKTTTANSASSEKSDISDLIEDTEQESNVRRRKKGEGEEEDEEEEEDEILNEEVEESRAKRD